MKVFLLLPVMFHSSIQLDEYHVKIPWSYEEDDLLGPLHWSKVNDKCIGSRQSPINLSGAEHNPNYGELTFNEDYKSNLAKKNLTNYGNALVIGVERSVPLVYGDDGLFDDARYQLKEIRFHWGSNNFKGSEHSIEGVKYPLEIQLIHFDSERDDSIDDSLGIPDAIVIFGVVAHVIEENHKELEKIFSHLHEVEFEGSTTTVREKIDFTKFLPEEKAFYKYTGSLTMPPCEEEVTWLVFKDPIGVSQRQINTLRNLKNNKGSLVNNFRQLQPLNGRKIFKSFKDLYLT